MTLAEIRNQLATINAERAQLRQQIEEEYIGPLQDPEGEKAKGLQQNLESSRRKSAEARARGTDGLARELDQRRFVDQLDGAIPILLMPLRVQTGFRTTANGRVLSIRAYPDDISVDRHEPRLSTSERAVGELFWAAPEKSTGPEKPERKAVWRGIVSRFSLRRAAWIIKATNPAAPQAGETLDVPVRVPAAWTLPERLVFRLFGESDHQLGGDIVGSPIPEGLEMGLDPTEPGLGFNRKGGTLEYPRELQWRTDFAEAVKVGMGIEIPLSQIGNPSKIERVVVVGVRLSTDEKQSTALLEQLLDGHGYTEGFSIVPQGTPPNITDNSDEPVLPDVDSTLERLTGRGEYKDKPDETLYENECDGLRLAHALCISPEAMRSVEHAGQEDGREAITMKRALWAGSGKLNQHDDSCHFCRIGTRGGQMICVMSFLVVDEESSTAQPAGSVHS